MNYGYSTITKAQVDAERERIKALTKKMTATPETARAYLIEAGILEKSGKRYTAQYHS